MEYNCPISLLAPGELALLLLGLLNDQRWSYLWFVGKTMKTCSSDGNCWHASSSHLLSCWHTGRRDRHTSHRCDSRQRAIACSPCSCLPWSKLCTSSQLPSPCEGTGRTRTRHLQDRESRGLNQMSRREAGNPMVNLWSQPLQKWCQDESTTSSINSAAIHISPKSETARLCLSGNYNSNDIAMISFKSNKKHYVVVVTFIGKIAKIIVNPEFSRSQPHPQQLKLILKCLCKKWFLRACLGTLSTLLQRKQV